MAKMLSRLRRTVNKWRVPPEAKPAPVPESEHLDAPRVIYLTARRAMGTVKGMRGPVREAGAHFEIRSYDWLLRQSALPRAAYILTDFDRLHGWYLETLARIAARLRADGVPVLNDPQRWRPRPALIRTLAAEGLIDYTCWLPAAGEWPDRFPCFLRTIAAHRGVASGRLEDSAAAEAALDRAMARGLCLSDLMFVEFCGAPVPDEAYYRKEAAYRVGDRIIRGLTVTDASWVAKHGVKGLSGDAFYAEELAETRDYPHAEAVRRIFDLASVAFGRMYFAWVEGRMQVYEINLNPGIKFDLTHPNADRNETQRLQRTYLSEALAALAPAPSRQMVDIADLVPEPGWDRVTLKQP